MNTGLFAKIGMIACLLAILIIPVQSKGEEITAYLATTPPIVEGFAKLVKENPGSTVIGMK